MEGSVLVIDDELEVLAVVRRGLEREGLKVSVARDGHSGLAALKDGRPDLVILDRVMPGGPDGLTVCREIRRDSEVPILMLSGRGETLDKVVGLEVGADDYLAKPFELSELTARVRALLRRSQGGDNGSRPEGRLQLGPLCIDRLAHRAFLNGQELPLTGAELALLSAMASEPDRVFSRQALLDRAHGPGHYVTERVVDSHIGHLRKKLAEVDPGFNPIGAVRGVGYRFEL